MKVLVDGTAVSDHIYHYLLAFNDKTNWDFMRRRFNKIKLHDLTISEYSELFEHAFAIDIKNL